MPERHLVSQSEDAGTRTQGEQVYDEGTIGYTDHARKQSNLSLCALQTPTNIGFVDTEPSTQPVWLLYPVCFPDADLVQKLYDASDRPLHEVMAQRLKRSGESKE